MSLRMVQQLAGAALIALSIGCSNDDSDEGASESGTYGEAICKKIAGCSGVELYTTVDQCVDRVDALAAKANAECQKCARAITCDGWNAIALDSRKECVICPSCCTVPTGSGGAGGASGNDFDF